MLQLAAESEPWCLKGGRSNGVLATRLTGAINILRRSEHVAVSLAFRANE